MIHYEKPIISIDTGMAEGIYAASGATANAVSLSGLTQTDNWGSDNGRLKFTADFSKLSNKSQLTLTVTFSSNITTAYGGGSSTSINGNTATFTFWSAPESPELYIQVNTNLSGIKITGYTYANA